MRNAAGSRFSWPVIFVTVQWFGCFSLQDRLEAVAALNWALEDRPFQVPSAVHTSRRLSAFDRHYNPNDLQH